MIQFQVYLRAELGKLQHRGDAESFLAGVPSDLVRECGLPPDPDELTQRLPNQDAVDVFVAGLVIGSLLRLAQHCSKEWRKNDVFDKLNGASRWQEEDVPTQAIRLQQAEPCLGDLFRENDYSLLRIAADQRIMSREPYCHHRPGELVCYGTCLARREGAAFRIFDGMHRAIQLVRNGFGAIRLCYAEEDETA